MSNQLAVAFVDMDVNVVSMMGNTGKLLLRDLSGAFEFGTISALMGSSGSGKTTLLKCLMGSSKYRFGARTQVYCNPECKIRSCYINQDQNERLLHGLTVRQALTYASQLKNSGRDASGGSGSDQSPVVQKFSHSRRIRELMVELMIRDIKDNRVDRCSGGELKRLMIAMELTSVLLPNVMFLDEPTTGLDSNAADIVISCLKTLSRKHNIAIITSIHQPNNELFMLFDNVYVLAKQGVNIYWGRPDGLALHLRECGITTGTATTTTTPSITSAVDICDNDTEPDIQFPIEVLLKYSSKAVTTDERVQRLAAKTGQLRHGLRRQCAEGAMHLTPGFTRNRSKRFNFPDFYHLLLRHSLYTYVCQWRPLVAQIVFYILFLLCLTFAYNRDIGKIDGCSVNGTQFNQTCQELEHSMGIMEQNLYHQYIASVSIFTLHTAISTSFFLSEIKVFTSEHQNKWYGTGSYYWAKTLVEQILSIIFAYIYTIIMYIISGQKQESSRFYKYLYISLMAFMCSQTLGSIIGLICHRNARLALCVAVAIYSTLHYFNNFIVPTKDLFEIFQITSDFVYAKFEFNAKLLIMYGFGRCPEGSTAHVLNQYSVGPDSMYWRYCGYLFCSYLVLKCSELTALLIKANKVSINMMVCWLKACAGRGRSKNGQSVLIFGPEFQRLNSDCTDTECGGDGGGTGSVEPTENNNHNSLDVDTKPVTIDTVPDVTTGAAAAPVRFKSANLMIVWADLSFEMRPKLCRCQRGDGSGPLILDGIAGAIEYGTLNGLLGPSGSGKTTLMRCLNGRQSRPMTPDSLVYVNRQEPVVACFVTQNTAEHLLEGLTGRQTLVYAWKLKNSRLSRKETDVSLRAGVDDLLRELMISNIGDTLVERCSGGEQKRLAIATELTSRVKPNMLCIDEPTSGLDSDAAEVVVRCLRALTRRHRIAIVASIHQPNNELFLMFDTINVLAKGGHVVYAGPPDGLRARLAECDLPCGSGEAPIEKVLKHSAQGVTGNPAIDRMRRKAAELRDQLVKQCHQMSADMELMPTGAGLPTRAKWFTVIDFWYLLVRTMRIAYLSQWKALVIQFCVCIFIALPFSRSLNEDMVVPDSCLATNMTADLLECADSGLYLESQALISQNIKYNIVFMTLVTYLQIVITPLTFTSDVNIFINEQRNGWYSSGAYYWAKSTVDICPVLVTLLPFIGIMNKYKSWSKFGAYYGFLSISTLCSQSVGHIAGIVFSQDSKMALVLSFGIHYSMMILGNCIIPVKEFHRYIQYISHVSYIKHAFESIMIVIYGFDRCPAGTQSSVLNRFDLADDDRGIFWTNVRNMLIVFLGLKMLALFLLIFKSNYRLFRLSRRQPRPASGQPVPNGTGNDSNDSQNVVKLYEFDTISGHNDDYNDYNEREVSKM